MGLGRVLSIYLSVNGNHAHMPSNWMDESSFIQYSTALEESVHGIKNVEA